MAIVFTDYLTTKKSAHKIWSKDLMYKKIFRLSNRKPFGYLFTSCQRLITSQKKINLHKSFRFLSVFYFYSCA